MRTTTYQVGGGALSDVGFCLQVATQAWLAERDRKQVETLVHYYQVLLRLSPRVQEAKQWVLVPAREDYATA